MSEAGALTALDKALDERDAAREEMRGARAVIIALIHKFGPVDLSVAEIMHADDLIVSVVAGRDGFNYRTRSKG